MTIKLKLNGSEVGAKSLPSVLGGAARSGDSGENDPLLHGLVRVTKEYDLAVPGRGDVELEQKLPVDEKQLVALEAEDGSTVFMRIDQLTETLRRVRPEAIAADGTLDLTKLTDPNAASRGVGEWLWRKLRVVELGSGGIVELATEKVREWTGDKVEGELFKAGAYLGTKALMWAIESKLAGEDGLYDWTHGRSLRPGDRRPAGDPELAKAVERGRMLVLIHGTASSTEGSYKALTEDHATWSALQRRFPGGIYGFEHRTFSKSPAQNALELLEALPDGAQISLLTHSRGGLVGDLLCLATDNDKDARNYVRNLQPQNADLRVEYARADDEERALLRKILLLKRHKQLTLDRYVRVACPARGTRLLSDNLDVFMSGFLTLVQRTGSAIASALGTPAAGQTTSTVLGVLRRAVLEIAKNRLEPQLVPGIAAMGVDSPLAVYLGHAETARASVEMAVVSGDTEFEGFGLNSMGRRIANLLADWALFGPEQENDLVVDTDSMYAGLGRRPGTRYLFNKSDAVDHFHYFRNPLTRDAVRQWLALDEILGIREFQPLAGSAVPWRERAASRSRATAAGARPIAVIVPGVLGSHLGRGGDPRRRIWFNLAGLIEGGFASLEDLASTDDAIVAEAPFARFYGDFADHLAVNHEVVAFAYDWRKNVWDLADALADVIAGQLGQAPGQPIRVVAHSMGGLVVRALIAKKPELWGQLVDRGGRVLMLGTPNQGSYAMVHTLLGKDRTTRQLALIDRHHNLQDVLDVVACFPGALTLLPQPPRAGASATAAGTPLDFFAAKTWERLAALNRDRWFGDGCGGVPTDEVLTKARQFWTAVGNGDLPNPERVSYVLGQAKETPVGLRERVRGDDVRLELLFTREGDGSVPWSSAELPGLPDSRYWFMPVSHAELASSKQHFAALVELLTAGETDKLGRRPRSRGAEVPVFTREAPPPVMPNEEDLTFGVFGSDPPRVRVATDIRRLKLSVRAGDVRHVRRPVLCGHFRDDAISGPEATLDALFDGRLSERERLGLYAGPVGTSAIVLMHQSPDERRKGEQRGAVIVGLGDANDALSSREVTATVRAAVLRVLMTVRDLLPRDRRGMPLASLLIGYNSSPNITILESAAAVALGVAEANHQFASAVDARDGEPVAITELTFIELYLDAAITAARAIRELPERLAADLMRTRTQLEPARELHKGEGFRPRLLAVGSGGDYWPRLIVTDADRDDDDACPPECYGERVVSPIPRDVRARLCGHVAPCDCKQAGNAGGAGDREGDAGGPATPDPGRGYLPARLKYVFSSRRARAESIVQSRQPGLLEKLIAEQTRRIHFQPELGRLLFELMVPLDFKAAARDQQSLVLVVDGYSANLPWEMMQADEEPVVVRTAVVRQLATRKFRRAVRTAPRDAVCIIASPSTTGFAREFGGSELSELPAAEKEGEEIRARFQVLKPAALEGETIRGTFEGRWSAPAVTYVQPGAPALEVLARLYERPYRVLTIAAHGVFEAQARDGSLRSGVVLSDGILLTPVEIGQMEVVPELVFLNCCHLAKDGVGSNRAPSKLAGSVARELIAMGVRCVIAAGWAVADDAARTFAECFFQEMLQNATFGEAVHRARRATFNQHRNTNTWGAYQAYGDPSFRLHTAPPLHAGVDWPLTTIDEAIDAIAAYRARMPKSKAVRDVDTWVSDLLAPCPGEWRRHPEVSQALGRLYADLGSAGFERARGHYLLAISEQDKNFGVAINAIEQLGNLEARIGEQRGRAAAEQGSAVDLDSAIKLVESALARFKALDDLAKPGDGYTGERPRPNPERASLRGSAHKRLAVLMARRGDDWSRVREQLIESSNAYALGEPAPYAVHNRTQLALLIGGEQAGGELSESEKLAIHAAVETAIDASAEEYGRSDDFFAGITVPDLQLTRLLLEPAGQSVSELLQRYRDVLARYSGSARERDSVTTQLEILKTLLERRSTPLTPRDAERVQLLDDLRRGLAVADAGPAGPPRSAAIQP